MSAESVVSIQEMNQITKGFGRKRLIDFFYSMQSAEMYPSEREHEDCVVMRAHIYAILHRMNKLDRTLFETNVQFKKK